MVDGSAEFRLKYLRRGFFHFQILFDSWMLARSANVVNSRASIVIAPGFWNMVVLLPYRSFPFAHEKKRKCDGNNHLYTNTDVPNGKLRQNWQNAKPQLTLTVQEAHCAPVMSMASIEMKSARVSHSGLSSMKNASNGETMFAFVFDKYQHITRIHRTCI